MREEHETGATHISETMRRVLTSEMERSLIPKHIFVQMDICTRENKNRFVFAYLERLVARGKATEIVVSFLPI